MLSVPFEEFVNRPETECQIYAGSKSMILGSRRCLGVPALVILGSKGGKELGLLLAKAQSLGFLKAWPLDDNKCIW